MARSTLVARPSGFPPSASSISIGNTSWGRGEDDPVFAREFPELMYHALDHRREHIEAANNDHVVGAADNAKTRRGDAVCGLAGAGQGNDVAGTEANQRLAFAHEVGQHQFA